jgi:hypothetical protein
MFGLMKGRAQCECLSIYTVVTYPLRQYWRKIRIWTLADLSRPSGTPDSSMPASYWTLSHLSQKYDQIWVLLDLSTGGDNDDGVDSMQEVLITPTAMLLVANLRGFSRTLEVATGSVNVRTAWVCGGADAARTIRCNQCLRHHITYFLGL